VSVSAQAGVTYYDVYGNAIPINTSYPASLWISKTLNSSQTQFNPVNSSSLANSSNQLLTFSATLLSPKIALNIDLRPKNLTSSYLLVIKFGDLPFINTSSSYYDLFQVFCPVNLTQSGNDTYYDYFLPGSSTPNQTLIGYGIRDLTTTEFNLYCGNTSVSANSSQPPVLKSSSSSNLVNSTYTLRVYQTCCLFFVPNTLDWLWKGVTVLKDSNLTHTHCQTNHLTDFAGGYVALPATINFGTVFANASFLQNPTIYVTVIVIISSYIILCLFVLYLDKLDACKTNLYVMADNGMSDLYFYEVVVFTGNRKDAGTNSNVSFDLCGEINDTSNRHLKPAVKKHKKILQRASVETFIMSVKK
jgi:hypothetical protein